jgi:hypothetical protein
LVATRPAWRKERIDCISKGEGEQAKNCSLKGKEISARSKLMHRRRAVTRCRPGFRPYLRRATFSLPTGALYSFMSRPRQVADPQSLEDRVAGKGYIVPNAKLGVLNHRRQTCLQIIQIAVFRLFRQPSRTSNQHCFHIGKASKPIRMCNQHILNMAQHIAGKSDSAYHFLTRPSSPRGCIMRGAGLLKEHQSGKYGKQGTVWLRSP